MTNFGNRLREERKRIGLSGEALGEIGGVKKFAQSNYETGKRYPDGKYLMAVAEAGVDVQYVLTGEPGQRPVTKPIDAERMVEIAQRLEKVATAAGKRWPASQLVAVAVEVYNFFLNEAMEEDQVERVLKLVVNR